MDELDQGTVLYGCRSQKYPDLCCYGVIITARCDIANKKVAKLYYLTAIDAQEWICTNFAYQQAYKNAISSKVKAFTDQAKKCFNGELLLRMPKEDAELIIDSEETMSSKQKDSLKSDLEEVAPYVIADKDDTTRKALIKCNPKPATDYLSKIGKGEITHYYYLPQVAYLNGSERSKGIIVDLQEIASITMEDARQILTPGIDYRLFGTYDFEKRKRYTQYFWLQNNEDFVAVEGAIRSPWCEHLMQRFSFAFTRIGINGASNHDFENLIKSIGG
ncbi:MAG: hypothetical protein AAGU75_18140 [Bacillota bacterium]